MTDEPPRIRTCRVRPIPGSDLIELTMLVGSSPAVVSRSMSPVLALAIAEALKRAVPLARPEVPE